MKKAFALILTLMLMATMLPAAAAPRATDEVLHIMGPWVVILQPTCEKPGQEMRTCERGDGYSEYRDIPKLGHDYGPWKVTKDPTCTEKGVKATHCRRCNLLWDEDLEPLGHDWSEWYVVNPPVGATPGLEERICQRCGITEQREIPGSEDENPVWNPALSLELVSASQPMTEGDNVHSLWKVTNVGDADINVCLYTFRNVGSDEMAPHSFAWVDEGSTVGDDSVMQPGETMLFSVDFLVNADDLAAGHVARVATAEGYLQFNGGNVYYPDGSPVVITSNAAELDLPLSGAELNGELFLELLSASQPMTEGDNVHTVWKVTNVGEASTSLNFYRYRKPTKIENDPNTLTWIDEGSTMGGGSSSALLDPGEWQLFSLDFLVDAEDMAAGHVARILSVGGYIYANDDILLTPEGEWVELVSNVVELELPLTAGWLEVTKTIENKPADGAAFWTGEEIHYLITVTNASPVTLTSTVIYDTLYGYDPMTDLGVLEPGQTASCTFVYTVTEWDAGKNLLNTVIAVGTYQPGRTLVGSAEVECMTHPKDEPGFDGVLTKSEISIPADGYYREGDEIEYTITLTNTGDVHYNDVDFFDSQTMDSIGTVHNLRPGESYTLTWKHKVTGEDVGLIIHNTAYADVYTDEGCTLLVSETVTSLTGGDDDDHDEDDDFDLPESGDDSCVRTLVACGAEGYTYELHFCGKHGGTQKDVLILIPEGASPEVEAAAWEYAAGYWKDAVAEEYAALYDAAGGAAKSSVMGEQLAFAAMADNMTRVLKMRYPEHPEKAACLAARLWENKCVDLCWLIHHGSEQRPDHLTETGDVLSASACGIAVTEVADDHDRYVDSLCDVHVNTDKLCRMMLRQNEPEKAWSMTASLWQREADKQFEKLWRDAEATDKPAVRTAANAFAAWLDCQHVLYSHIYAPAVVDEINARSAMELVLMLCPAD